MGRTRTTHDLVNLLPRTSVNQTALQVLLQSGNQAVQLGSNRFQRSLDLYPFGSNILGLGRKFETRKQLLEGSSSGGGIVLQGEQSVLCDSRYLCLQVGTDDTGDLSNTSLASNSS